MRELFFYHCGLCKRAYPPIGKMACDILLMFDGFLVLCNLCQSADMDSNYDLKKSSINSLPILYKTRSILSSAIQ